jgi:hypothetical protein
MYSSIDPENPESWLRAFIIIQSWDGQEVHADELPIGSRQVSRALDFCSVFMFLLTLFRYIVCLYYALMQISTVGFGDIYPHSVAELGVVLLLLILFLPIFPWVVGEASTVLLKFNVRENEYRFNVDEGRRLLLHCGCSQQLEHRVTQYYSHGYMASLTYVDPSSILEDMPAEVGHAHWNLLPSPSHPLCR